MMEIELPEIKIEESEDGTHATAVVEPLERGFGITLGNSLRRILLSALPGAAVQGIRFLDESNPVPHEFSSVKGIREDVTEIILNLKSLAIKSVSLDKDFKKTIHIYKEGPYVLKASDLEVDAEIQVMNPDLYILTINEGGVLDLELTIGRGRGYKGASENKNPKNPINFIATDSIYTPVKKVNYNVENTRVGQDTDKDKLVLDIWTNGTLSGRDVLCLAANIMLLHIKEFADISENIPQVDSKQNGNKQGTQVLDKTIEDMELSVRSHNCLKRAGIQTVRDLIEKTEGDMLKVKNLGRQSLQEIIAKLAEYGLALKKEED